MLYQKNLGLICSEHALQRPDDIALIDIRDNGDEIFVTYGQLDERCNRVANYLTGLGLTVGDRVFVLTGNRAEFIEIILGVMRAGFIPVPANARGGADGLRHCLIDSGAAAIVADLDANGYVQAIADEFSNLIKVAVGRVSPGWRSHEELLSLADGDFEAKSLSPDALIMLAYTSGSTGKPKGVTLTQGGQSWWLETALRRSHSVFNAGQRILVGVPLFHKNAMSGAVKPFLAVGGSIVILQSYEPRRYLDVLAKHCCTQTTGVPALYSPLLNILDYADQLDLSSWEFLRIGSAPCDTSLLQSLEQSFGVAISQAYGLTEGGPVMMGPPVDGRSVPLGSCGVAWDEGEVKLVTPEGKESKEYGELWVRNPGVTPGYYGLDDLNKERLKDGWLKTGDIFVCDEQGFFYFKGRMDDMMVCGGENIYPMEVEAVLRGHPAVSDVCVVALPDEAKGEVPGAAVVFKSGKTTTELELKDYYLAQSTAYSHPRLIQFLSALPTSGAGKVDRKLVNKLLVEKWVASDRGQRSSAGASA